MVRSLPNGGQLVSTWNETGSILRALNSRGLWPGLSKVGMMQEETAGGQTTGLGCPHL